MASGPAAFLDHLAGAVRIPTVSWDGSGDETAFERFADWLESTYPLVWGTLVVDRIGVHSRLLTWPGSDPAAGPVLLLAHSDVVPVEEPASWSRAAFGGDRTTSHLVGRGSLDDKAALIGILETVEGLLATGFEPRRTLLVGIGHDEERGGHAGAAAIAALLRERGIRPAMLLDEGGFVTEGIVPGTRCPVALIGISEKGAVDVELTARGATGHSSAPPRHTAVGRVAAAVAALEASPVPARPEVLAPCLEAAVPAFRRPLGRILPRIATSRLTGPRLMRRRPELDALIRTTTAATVIAGGVKSNVLPASARAVVNYRIMPGDSVASVLDHVRERAGDDVEVTALPGASEPAPLSHPRGPAYGWVSEAITGAFPEAVPVPWVLTGMTDSRHFAGLADQIYRFVPLRVGPDELAGFHGVDERVRLDDAPRVLEFYRRLVVAACTG